MIRRPNTLNIESQLESYRKCICRMQGGGEDLYQEVCLRCLERAADRHWSEPQFGFIRQVARRIAIDMHRRRNVRKLISEQSDLNPESPDIEPGDLCLEDEACGLLRARLARIPKPQREALTERYLKGKSAEQIATKRCLPVDTVKTRIRRGLEKLRRDAVLRTYFEE